MVRFLHPPPTIGSVWIRRKAPRSQSRGRKARRVRSGFYQFTSKERTIDDQSFKPGDVVRLKSGGPSMTIEQVSNKAIRCAWFNSGGGYNSGVFHVDTLERA